MIKNGIVENKNLKKNWSPTDKRFVAFLDILGFRDFVMRNTHEFIYNKLIKISKYLEKFNHLEDNSELYNMYNDTGLYSVSFSDSIFIFSKNDTSENFDLFTKLTSFLFAKSIENEIPVKGAIAYGEITVIKSKQIYFGQPIIDAYLLQEDVNYYGIVAHNSIDEYLRDNNPDTKDRYIETIAPLKCGNISHLNLNWFKNISIKEGEDIKSTSLNKINNFKTKTSGSPRRYLDNTIKVINNIYT